MAKKVKVPKVAPKIVPPAKELFYSQCTACGYKSKCREEQYSICDRCNAACASIPCAP